MKERRGIPEEVFPFDIAELKESDYLIGIARKQFIVTRDVLQFEHYLPLWHESITDFIENHYLISDADMFSPDTMSILQRKNKPIAVLAYYIRSKEEAHKTERDITEE